MYEIYIYIQWDAFYNNAIFKAQKEEHPECVCPYMPFHCNINVVCFVFGLKVSFQLAGWRSETMLEKLRKIK